MTRGYLNNNPLNIEQSKGKPWNGEIRPSQDMRFAQFKSMAFGYRAAFRLLQNYEKLHGCKILADFINRWCPPTEKGNHTDKYIEIVATRCHITAESVIDTHNEFLMRKIVAAMSYVENGIEADEELVKAGWDLLKKM